MSTQILNIPDLGEAEDVEVIEICVKPGDIVSEEDPIVVLESDKAAMEIPTSLGGKVLAIKVSVGDKVTAGSPFLEIEGDADEPSIDIKKPAIDSAMVPEISRAPAKLEEVIEQPIQAAPPQDSSNRDSVYAGPAVRKLAREFGIQLSLVSPSGPKSRIQKEDLHAFVKASLRGASSGAFTFTQPNIDYSKWGSVEEQLLSKFQKSSLNNLHTSWINIPHVTQHDECDLSKLLDLRTQLNTKHKLKISPLAFIAKVTSDVLEEFPMLNSSLDQGLEKIIVKNYVNLGIAVDTPEGLIVPNIKNVQEKSIVNIAEEIAMLASAAKTRKLKLPDLKGASFTISSLGAIGGKFFTPIINPPEMGILGLSRTFSKVVSKNEGFESREFLPLSLSYDHRVINGVYAAQFITQLGAALGDTLLMEKNFK
ncbi:2-oxo acid dehydrogenase subunit E2 [Gammaproteobacteria bacterium]|nr:2-oxo acid dehydrogenase subunit E2 [Gammaproteobacteria bacterium]MDB9816041.1 2-oxo acid dehydrogenase subunit E2 [Gammaproteobacteria bacterium]MDB9859490.1 2-oxo acid dehydrogenase subunit E2 [Gammaproteobacteria bacterium]